MEILILQNGHIVPDGAPARGMYLTSGSEYASVNGQSLVLRMDDHSIEKDNVPYHFGGIQTSTRFNGTYGKIEVSAKFKNGKWIMTCQMADTRAPYSASDWSNSGEIDIIEHINNEAVVYQTIQNVLVTKTDGVSSATHSGAYKDGDFNTYVIIWLLDAIQFFINEVL